MKQLRKKTSTIWLGLIIYTLAVFSGLSNSVLCFGSDGQIMMKSSVRDTCYSDTAVVLDKISSSRKNVETPSEHCGPCIDVPFTEGIKENQITSGQFRLTKKDPVNVTSLNNVNITETVPVHHRLYTKQNPDIKNPVTSIIHTTILIV